jgi:hypothetical protein
MTGQSISWNVFDHVLWCTVFMAGGVPNLNHAFELLIPEERLWDLNVSGLQELVFETVRCGDRDYFKSTYSMTLWTITNPMAFEDTQNSKRILKEMQFDHETGSEVQGRATRLPPFGKLGSKFFGAMLKDHQHILAILKRRNAPSLSIATGALFISIQ